MHQRLHLATGKTNVSRKFISFISILYSAACASPALPKQESIAIAPLADLQFGTFAVFATGSREITPSGGAINTGIAPVSGDAIGPAEFEIVYDRGNNAANPPPQTLVIGVTLLSVAAANGTGLTGTLSNFTSNLPGRPSITPNQMVTATIPNCLTRICRLPFRIGGKLTVSRTTGGGLLTFTLPMTATLLTINGSPP